MSSSLVSLKTRCAERLLYFVSVEAQTSSSWLKFLERRPALECSCHLTMVRDVATVVSARLPSYRGSNMSTPVTRAQNSEEAPVDEWSRYRIVAGLFTSSSPVPLKTRRVGERCTLNLSRAQTSSRWCGVVVRRGGASSGVVHLT
ncbi:uncharacterized protein TNCV_2377161 [Trichonephila clavipes]|nr:uncharacterized protein TNCV_2377161 [Trichonephila clavipes]